MISAGSCYPKIEVERQVDTVIIRQEDQVIFLDEWFVKGLREALFDMAPRTEGP